MIVVVTIVPVVVVEFEVSTCHRHSLMKMTQQAAVLSTQHKSKERGSLESVNACISSGDRDVPGIHLCRLGHPHILQSVARCRRRRGRLKILNLKPFFKAYVIIASRATCELHPNPFNLDSNTSESPRHSNVTYMSSKLVGTAKPIPCR